MSHYMDLLITPDGDFTLDSGNEPVPCNDLTSIGQDVRHAVIESGLATQLIAERSPTLRADILTQIELLVEEDVRLVPGTIVVSQESLTRITITAQAYGFDDDVNAAVEVTS
ncbi:DUF2590 family protein [Serratia marcescens]|uniref:DUF2590 family protein n=1 Tax=Serratia marcescens TaxID=615 RepID=UPI00217AADCD|nr:DUF2590 family protein [Serratia marcescens]CAI1951047.1 Protein of uncharacterised function (DUF2590) [Serratia marcescens]